MSTEIKSIIKAFRARRHYKRQGYEALPCIHCVWEHESLDTETPWQWILCDHCDWGNH